MADATATTALPVPAFCKGEAQAQSGGAAGPRRPFASGDLVLGTRPGPADSHLRINGNRPDCGGCGVAGDGGAAVFGQNNSRPSLFFLSAAGLDTGRIAGNGGGVDAAQNTGTTSFHRAVCRVPVPAAAHASCGTTINGARRWIGYGLTIQASEFLKPVFAVTLAWILSWK